MIKETGGAAFPQVRGDLYGGMSLRDYFAGKVLPSLFANARSAEDVLTTPSLAYKFADAMLTERSK